MFEKYFFEVPLHLQPGIDSGILTRFGAIIKNTQTGKIVAHLQETGVGQQVISSLASSPFSALETVSSLAANAQLVQLKKMVKSLQVLQYANLGIGLAGIGVTVVGFAVVSKKLNNIKETVERLSKEGLNNC